LISSWFVEVDDYASDTDEHWVDAKLLAADLQELIEALHKAEPEPVWWYDSANTLSELRALSETIVLANTRQAREVRIVLY
jgi:hypothetical protein